MNLSSLPVNAFDVVLIVVLLMGLFQGRKHGMSEELMGLIKWVLIVLGCAFFYEPAGRALAQSSPFSLLSSFLMVYAVAAVVILGIFGLFRHQLGDKLVGSDVFGKSEYYLGMGSGLVRCGCMLLAVLALLNARYFTRDEVVAMQRFQNDVYGSTYFPTWHTAQEVVFEKSLTGPWIRNHLGFLLIRPTKPEHRQFRQQEVALP